MGATEGRPDRLNSLLADKKPSKNPASSYHLIQFSVLVLGDRLA